MNFRNHAVRKQTVVSARGRLPGRGVLSAPVTKTENAEFLAQSCG